LPGFEILAKCKDPVVILMDPPAISEVTLPVADDDLIVLVVERNTEGMVFDERKFYAWAMGDHVHVGWLKSEPLPEDAKCIGQVVFGMIDLKPELRKSTSCWEEENEAYT